MQTIREPVGSDIAEHADLTLLGNQRGSWRQVKDRVDDQVAVN